jgi:adenine deaminase
VERTQLVEAARGDRPLDIAITNAQLVNVFTCEAYPADIGIYGDRIAVVGPAGAYKLKAKQIIDGTGKWAAPGFVDTHLHIESTMVTPASYAAGVLPFGTTTSVIDPHEIGNVLGMDGIRYMIEGSNGLPLRVYIAISSCVPAVPGKETSGANFGPSEVTEMLTWPRVISVAEVMDYKAVINGSSKMLGIVQAGLEANVVIQGHSPLLVGRDLNAYLAAGVENDHELRQGEEGLEKLRLGILPLLKVNSHGNHVPRILPTLKQAPFLDIALCTDDVEPADLLENGHMDRVIREMIAHDIDPIVAIRWATLNGARHYHLRDHGAIAPGYYADIVLLSSLEKVKTNDVLVGGKMVVQNEKLIVAIEEPPTTLAVEDTVRVQHPLTADSFRLNAPASSGQIKVNLLVLDKARPTRMETTSVWLNGADVTPADLGQGVCYISIVPRHGQSHPPAKAFLKGLGLNRGTLATTIAHDSHNIIVTGHRVEDMLLAVRELEACGGGIVLIDNGQVLGKVELPLAGLMSFKSIPELAEDMRLLNQLVRELGVDHPAQALATTGLALTVVPEIRMSDLGGLMNVATQEFVRVFD